MGFKHNSFILADIASTEIRKRVAKKLENYESLPTWFESEKETLFWTGRCVRIENRTFKSHGETEYYEKTPDYRFYKFVTGEEFLSWFEESDDLFGSFKESIEEDMQDLPHDKELIWLYEENDHEAKLCYYDAENNSTFGPDGKRNSGVDVKRFERLDGDIVVPRWVKAELED